MGESRRREYNKELWMEEANCKGRTKEFYDTTSPGRIPIAKQICSSCLVQRSCLAYALLYLDPDNDLVWGGQSKSERRRIYSLGKLNPDFLSVQEAILIDYYNNRYGNIPAYKSHINSIIISFNTSISDAFAHLKFVI